MQHEIKTDGAHHKLALLVMTNRVTLITVIEKLDRKNVILLANKIIEKLSHFNTSMCQNFNF